MSEFKQFPILFKLQPTSNVYILETRFSISNVLIRSPVAEGIL